MNRRRFSVTIAAASAVVMCLAACSADTSSAPTGADQGGGKGSEQAGSSDAGKSITVLMVNNPQMMDLEKLTADHFTKKTGIEVKFTILPENELRDKVTQDVATNAGQYDVVTVGAYEGSVWTANDWLVNLQPKADADKDFDVKDIMPAMKGVLSKDDNFYAIPFYGESAFTMYRKDLFDEYGLTMPDKPTWDDILKLATELKAKLPADISPICLRGQAGWGQNMAIVGAFLNAYGGGYFDENYNPIFNSEPTKKALGMYLELITKYGQAGAAQAGFTECLNNFGQGQSAIWFDATSGASSLESPDQSKVAGKVGYVDAPREAARSGWVWSWAWAMPKSTKDADTAWKFISWASSKEYEQLAGKTLGWTRLPNGKRISTFDIPEYKDAAKAYTQQMQTAIADSDPANCSTIKRPAPGCQYLAIPEFQDLGTKIGQEVSAAVSGQKTLEEVISTGQGYVEKVGAKKK